MRGLALGLSLALAGCGITDRDIERGSARLVDVARAKGVTDGRVLDALRAVPRHEFVPLLNQGHAVHDHSVPIELGQRITQPSLVGRMTQALELRVHDKVLEVGTGTGYQAAILATLAPRVFSIELLPELATTAEARLERLGFTTIRVRAGDGWAGWPDEAPFDAIIVTCAAERVPDALVDQLAEGGRLVIPVGPEEGEQRLLVLRKTRGSAVTTDLGPVHFVPFVHD